MGECHCTKIAIMQLFHELKQQFPALPDHVVSQCIVQNSYDKQTCERSLRATQESRPPPGAFPPPPPQDTPDSLSCIFMNQKEQQPASESSVRLATVGHQPPQPSSLNIGYIDGRRQSKVTPTMGQSPLMEQSTFAKLDRPSLASVARATPEFFEEELIGIGAPIGSGSLGLSITPPTLTSYSQGFADHPNSSSASQMILSPARAQQQQQREPPAQQRAQPQPETTRSCTTINLTLRPPSCKPQPPIDVYSQGSYLGMSLQPHTDVHSQGSYSSSSLIPRSFQRHLKIDVGDDGYDDVVTGNIGSSSVPQLGTAGLLAIAQNPSEARRLPGFAGLSDGPPSQLPRPTTTRSAPISPSKTMYDMELRCCSLPSYLESASTTCFGGFPRIPPDELKYPIDIPPEFQEILEEVPDEYKELITRQLFRKDRLATLVEKEERKLEALKKEVEDLSKPPEVPPEEMERQLRSEIYQLQLACDQLATEVFQYSDLPIPLGETNEEFYKEIYTGQQYVPKESNTEEPPPPSQTPALSPPSIPTFDNEEDAEGPSWVCERCTFDNHPLMDKCEECNMPKRFESSQGESQDIHIRVTHHHNIPPRRTINNWVV